MKTLNEFIWDEDGVIQEDDEDAGTMAMITNCIAICCDFSGNIYHPPHFLSACPWPIGP